MRGSRGMLRLTRWFQRPATRRAVVLLAVAIGGIALIGTAFAAGFSIRPQPWEIGMQPAATPVKARLIEFHDELLVIITLITLFVMGLLLYVIVRFNSRRHPQPSHTTPIEVMWTVIPVLILVIIAVPSFKLMYYMD